MEEATEHIILSFLKFGKKEHIQDLYGNGTIFLNPIQYFRKLEDNGLRGDNYEGINKIHNLPSGEFKIESLNYKGKYISMQIKESYSEVLGNLYSLYAISSHGFPAPKDFKIDQRNSDFGKYCLLIKNVAAFLERIEESLKRNNLKFSKGFVDYYDANSTNGEISLFQKPKQYDHQKEFRFYVDQNSIKPLILNIGSLKDITEIFKTNDIIKGLELTQKEEP